MLEVRQRSLGADHPELAGTFLNLGNVYVSQGRLDAAEPYYKRALALREKALAADDIELAAPCYNLGCLYLTLARAGDAEPLLRRALTIVPQEGVGECKLRAGLVGRYENSGTP